MDAKSVNLRDSIKKTQRDLLDIKKNTIKQIAATKITLKTQHTSAITAAYNDGMKAVITQLEKFINTQKKILATNISVANKLTTRDNKVTMKKISAADKKISPQDNKVVPKELTAQNRNPANATILTPLPTKKSLTKEQHVTTANENEHKKLHANSTKTSLHEKRLGILEREFNAAH